MLGMLRKIHLDVAVRQLQVLFRKMGHVVELVGFERLRFWRPLRTKQLATPATDFSSSNVLDKLLFCLRNLAPTHC